MQNIDCSSPLPQPNSSPDLTRYCMILSPLAFLFTARKRSSLSAAERYAFSARPQGLGGFFVSPLYFHYFFTIFNSRVCRPDKAKPQVLSGLRVSQYFIRKQQNTSARPVTIDVSAISDISLIRTFRLFRQCHFQPSLINERLHNR